MKNKLVHHYRLEAIGRKGVIMVADDLTLDTIDLEKALIIKMGTQPFNFFDTALKIRKVFPSETMIILVPNSTEFLRLIPTEKKVT